MKKRAAINPPRQPKLYAEVKIYRYAARCQWQLAPPGDATGALRSIYGRRNVHVMKVEVPTP
jgi:hypothetical protein